MKDDSGFSAIHEISRCAESAVGIAKVLLQNNNVDIEARTNFGLTALCLECSNKRRCGIVNLLVLHGADVNARSTNDPDMSTLRLAIGDNGPPNMALILDLLSYGALIDSGCILMDNSGLLRKIDRSMNKLRNSEKLDYDSDVIISDRDRTWMRNLAVAITFRAPQVAFKMWCIVRSFGIFMAAGYRTTTTYLHEGYEVRGVHHKKKFNTFELEHTGTFSNLIAKISLTCRMSFRWR